MNNAGDPSPSPSSQTAVDYDLSPHGDHDRALAHSLATQDQAAVSPVASTECEQLRHPGVRAPVDSSSSRTRAR